MLRGDEAGVRGTLRRIWAGRSGRVMAGLSRDDLYFRNNFDYVRLFAATQVLVFHAIKHLELAEPSWAFILAPFSGVPMFFVTSGFLITASYDRSPSFRGYAENRARRIFPALWACIAITAVITAALGFAVVSREGFVWFVAQIATVIYTPAFLKSFGFGSYNGSLWTIPVELQFYATVPVLTFVLSRVRARRAFLIGLLVAAVALAMLIRIRVPSVMGLDDTAEGFGDKLLRYSFVSHYYLFLAGALCYYLSLHVGPWLRGKALLWMALLLVLNWSLPFTAVTAVLIQLCLAFFTISVAYTFVRRNWLHGNDISYGTYLYHGLVMNLLVEFGLVGRQLYLWLTVALSYAAGLLSWRLLERRCLKRRVARREPLALGEAASR